MYAHTYLLSSDKKESKASNTQSSFTTSSMNPLNMAHDIPIFMDSCRELVNHTLMRVCPPGNSIITVKSGLYEKVCLSSLTKVSLWAAKQSSKPEVSIDMRDPNTTKALLSLAEKGLGECCQYGGVVFRFHPGAEMYRTPSKTDGRFLARIMEE
jgi:hypothetical protein